MDLHDTPEETAFRAELRAWLEENVPDELRGHRGGAARFEGPEMRAWSRSLHDAGYAGLTWPEEYGGGGAPYTHQAIFLEEMARAEAPPHIGVIGLGMAGPTIMAHGTKEQKARYLAPILSADEIWCQGFSEPGAGSDLASLQTRAERQGDDYIINGQKIWTSEGHYADWMILLARTDTEAPKHRGISYFLVDMKSPGITLSPLINLMNSHAFNQVFFDNVRVPAANRVGEENRGWYVATTTLDFERTGISRVIWALRQFEELVAFVRERRNRGAAWARKSSLRAKLAELRLEFEIGRLLCYRVAWQQAHGIVPNYESSMAKMYGSELLQRFGVSAVGILGLPGQVEPGSRWAPLQGRLDRTFQAGLSYTIAGGTSEIQRNIIAQRGLGLPRG